MKFEIYKDSANEWRWRLLAANGRKVADSGEGYKNRIDAISTINLIRSEAATAETKIETRAKMPYPF